MKRFLNTRYFILVLLMLCIARAASAGIPPRPNTTSDTLLVYDYAHIIDEPNFTVINDSLKSLFGFNGSQVVVLTVESLDGMSVEDYCQEVFESWGIGDKKTNSGVLILVKPKTGDSSQEKGKVSIHTGYGVEGVLPDLLCKKIQTDSMIPEFKKNNYGLAILKAVRTITPSIRGEYPAEIKEYLDSRQSKSFWMTLLYVIMYLIFGGGVWYFFFMPTKADWYSIMASPLIEASITSSSSRRSSSGSSWSSGSSSSGSSWSSSSSSSSSSGGWSWGGGSSGGGGASSSW